MSNMSYCRFENTFHDLRDCYEALRDRDVDGPSEHERNAMRGLLELCKKIAEEFEPEDITDMIQEDRE